VEPTEVYQRIGIGLDAGYGIVPLDPDAVILAAAIAAGEGKVTLHYQPP
jgi:hypothetical protein